MAYHACDSPDAVKARRITYVIGPDGRIERAFEKVDPPRHPREVLAGLTGSQEPTRAS